ncbi:MAG: hypothetical protein AB7O66_00580 [Limisphaerales bacterium]
MRGALAGFGVAALAAAGPALVDAWHHGLSRLFWVSLVAVPALVLGVVVLLLGLTGEIRPATPGESTINSASFRSAAAWPGLIEPERPWQDLVRWLLYGWTCIGVLVLARCLLIAFRDGPIAVPLWSWAIPLSVIPGMIWARRRTRFLQTWGRCRLQLLHRPERGRPLVGSIETGPRFQPTQDFHLRLTFQRWSFGTYWPPLWAAEETVPRERLEPTGQGYRIPFDFLSRAQSMPALDPGPCQCWRLVFTTQLDGKTYTESFAGLLPIKDAHRPTFPN